MTIDPKRLLDVIASGIGLFFSGPLPGALAGWVRLDSDGPALFRQTRVGLGGEEFTIHKLRTMHVGHNGPSVTADREFRITRAGRFLRRSKLDELPQLFDVLRGRMSLVGPRPEVPEYVAQWPAEHRDRILSVRPGITDPVSPELRNESELLAGAADPADYYVRELLPYKAAKYVEYVDTRPSVGTFASSCRLSGPWWPGDHRCRRPADPGHQWREHQLQLTHRDHAVHRAEPVPARAVDGAVLGAGRP
ncbi:sugar transferase [Nocardioides sp. B-3]|nr:sugar transferase [Nocardioides sp. B-3]